MDAVPLELLKYGKEFLVTLIHQPLIKVWEFELIPTE